MAFTTVTPEGMSEIWIAVLDRSGPPRRLVQGGDEVMFGGPSDLYYRSLEDKANFLMRIRKDASDRRRAIESPVLNLLDVSPNGEWAAVRVSGTGDNATPVMLAVPLRGGTPKTMCPGGCIPSWDPTGKWLYIGRTRHPEVNGIAGCPVGAWPGAARFAREHHRWGGQPHSSARGPCSRASPHRARPRPVHICVHETGPAAEPLPNTPSLNSNCLPPPGRRSS